MIADLDEFAGEVARFVVALAGVGTDDGPTAGPHSFWRGAHPRVYDQDVRRSLDQLDGEIDAIKARKVWDAALETEITAPSVWFHGDIAHGNLLVQRGRLTAVIDFGTAGVGDPACDLTIAWTMFDDSAREVFRRGLPWDAYVWVRGRAWALWKAMLLMTASSGSQNPGAEARGSRAVIENILREVP
jgi:aminoglycoside phosphotransferase (APT) family kinase protein